jgi:SAM-dependent methyltransferase
MFFPKKFNPKKIKVCNTKESRKRFKSSKNKNLRFLLEKRFLWMKNYLKGKKNIVELGSGNGACKDILKNKNIILTDIQKYPWISKKVDMNQLRLDNKYKKKVDVFIINQALHHCANPKRLLEKLNIYLKDGGFILINEPEISFFLKFFLYFLDDEAWSLEVNIFNGKKNIFNPNSVWDANNATATLLFEDENKFHINFTNYSIIKNELSEFFIFINSGGVVQKTFYIPVNRFFFNLLHFIDRLLISLFPKIFALGRTVVLQKKSQKII